MKLLSFKQKVLFTAICLWIAFIWFHSMIPGEDSSEESRIVGNYIRPFLELFVGSGNVTDHLVRKLAHFTEYCILGVLTGGFIKTVRHDFFGWSYGFLCALAVSVIDESIQLFSAGRSAQVTDILLDTSGSLTGLIFIWLMLIFFRSLRN